MINISFKLLSEKVSFGREDFHIITGCGIGQDVLLSLIEHDQAIRLRQLYLSDTANMNGYELDKDYSNP